MITRVDATIQMLGFRLQSLPVPGLFAILLGRLDHHIL